MTKRLGRVAVLCLALAAIAAGIHAQTVFPVRLDAPEPSAPLITATGGMSVSTGNHYTKRVVLTVTPDTNEDVLRIEFDDDNAITMRVTGSAFRTDSTPVVLVREELIVARLTSTGGYGSEAAVISEVNAADFIFIRTPDLIAPRSLRLQVKTPANFTQVVLWIEVLTTGPAVFAELF